MAYEIERKFLVDTHHPDVQQALAQPGARIRQGYLLHEGRGVLRVRIKDQEAFLTYKGRTTGISRPEFEYAIPLEDATDLLDHHCYAQLTKTRYAVPLGDGLVAELDVFDTIDLVMVEVELPDATTTFALPAWFGREVSQDMGYTNTALASHGLPRHL